MNKDTSEQDKLIKEIAKKENIDSRIIKTIVNYPMKFAKTKMSDLSDNRPIRIRYFGAFVHKNTESKKTKFFNKKNILIENLEDVAIMMSTILGFQLVNFESARNIIEEAFKQKDYEKINLIWNEWESYKK